MNYKCDGRISKDISFYDRCDSPSYSTRMNYKCDGRVSKNISFYESGKLVCVCVEKYYWNCVRWNSWPVCLCCINCCAFNGSRSVLCLAWLCSSTRTVFHSTVLHLLPIWQYIEVNVPPSHHHTTRTHTNCKNSVLLVWQRITEQDWQDMQETTKYRRSLSHNVVLSLQTKMAMQLTNAGLHRYIVTRTPQHDKHDVRPCSAAVCCANRHCSRASSRPACKSHDTHH